MGKLGIDEIRDLLAKPERKGYPPPTQFGPLRWHDKEMRCASRGCSSPTILKLEGIPRCGVHALRMMNEMLTSKNEIFQLTDEEYEQAIRAGRLTRGKGESDEESSV